MFNHKRIKKTLERHWEQLCPNAYHTPSPQPFVWHYSPFGYLLPLTKCWLNGGIWKLLPIKWKKMDLGDIFAFQAKYISEYIHIESEKNMHEHLNKIISDYWRLFIDSF